MIHVRDTWKVVFMVHDMKEEVDVIADNRDEAIISAFSYLMNQYVDLNDGDTVQLIYAKMR